MSLAHACPHQPLHYSYALTPSRCFGLFCSATAADQLKVEQQCLKCFSDFFPALAPHPSSLSSQIASPGHPQNQQQLQQRGEQGNAEDEEGNADMPIEDLEFLWKRAARQVSLHRSRHVAFLTKHLDVPFSEEMMELAASRPWLIYWMVHGLALLEALPRATYADRYDIMKFIHLLYFAHYDSKALERKAAFIQNTATQASVWVSVAWQVACIFLCVHMELLTSSVN